MSRDESESEDTHIHNPAVNVSELLEAEQTRAMSRIIEREALYELASVRRI